MNFASQGFRKLSSDRQTDRMDQNCKARRIAGDQLTRAHSESVDLRQDQTVEKVRLLWLKPY